MLALVAAALAFTPRKRPADREPIAEPLPRFRVPMQWVRYESGEHRAFAVVLVMLPKTAWMLKQEKVSASVADTLTAPHWWSVTSRNGRGESCVSNIVGEP